MDPPKREGVFDSGEERTRSQPSFFSMNEPTDERLDGRAHSSVENISSFGFSVGWVVSTKVNFRAEIAARRTTGKSDNPVCLLSSIRYITDSTDASFDSCTGNLKSTFPTLLSTSSPSISSVFGFPGRVSSPHTSPPILPSHPIPSLPPSLSLSHSPPSNPLFLQTQHRDTSNDCEVWLRSTVWEDVGEPDPPTEADTRSPAQEAAPGNQVTSLFQTPSQDPSTVSVSVLALLRMVGDTTVPGTEVSEVTPRLESSMIHRDIRSSSCVSRSLSPKQTYLLWWRHLIGFCAVYAVYRTTEVCFPSHIHPPQQSRHDFPCFFFSFCAAQVTIHASETLAKRLWAMFWIRRGSSYHKQVHELQSKLENAVSQFSAPLFVFPLWPITRMVCLPVPLRLSFL